MANEEHLAELGRGVPAWNKWSEEHGVVANLGGAYLCGANLRFADLFSADLHGADLTKTSLMGADLIGADLCGANLMSANLMSAKLNLANLMNADLRGANLFGANLCGANLSGANLKDAGLGDTVLGDTLLKDCKGLFECSIRGPCTIDLRTIKRSWPLPEKFLRGCGLPEHYINYLPSLLEEEAIRFYSCFISYSSKNEDFAKRLHADLQENAVRCWFAPEDMKIGDKIRDRIDQSIWVYDKLLLVLSKASVGSKWVEKEVETAFDKEDGETTVLFPIRLDDAVMETKKAWAADIRRARHIGDFTDWKSHDSYKAAFDRLMGDLKAQQ